jgi:hypothetical protein
LKFNTIQDQVEEVKLSIKEHRETEWGGDLCD